MNLRDCSRSVNCSPATESYASLSVSLRSQATLACEDDPETCKTVPATFQNSTGSVAVCTLNLSSNSCSTWMIKGIPLVCQDGNWDCLGDNPPLSKFSCSSYSKSDIGSSRTSWSVVGPSYKFCNGTLPAHLAVILQLETMVDFIY